MNNLNISEIFQIVPLGYGDRLVLLLVEDKKHEIAYNDYVRNIYKIDRYGNLIWQIKSNDDYDKDTGTYYSRLFQPYCQENIRDKNKWIGNKDPKYYPVNVSSVWAYRGSYTYAIDLETGHAEMMLYSMK